MSEQDDAQVAMKSSVTKRSRLPGTATATHGLRKTRGLRGGPLAGALHSMPAEASSAVVGEKKGQRMCTVVRVLRNGAPLPGFKG